MSRELLWDDVKSYNDGINIVLVAIDKFEKFQRTAPNAISDIEKLEPDFEKDQTTPSPSILLSPWTLVVKKSQISRANQNIKQ